MDNKVTFQLDSNKNLIAVPLSLSNEKLIALEYSKTQNAFHIDELSHIVSQNFKYLNDIVERTNDYKIIFVGTSEQCYELKRQIESSKEKV